MLMKVLARLGLFLHWWKHLVKVNFAELGELRESFGGVLAAWGTNAAR